MDQVDFKNLPDDALIRLYAMKLLGLVPFSTSTLWRKVRQGAFPSPIRVSSQITAWRVGDVRIWLADPVGYSLVSSDSTQGEAV